MKRNRLALVAAGAAVGFLASMVILPGIVEAFTARGSAGGEVLALEGGRIVTQTGDGVVTGTVLVRDGVIAEVGRRAEQVV